MLSIGNAALLNKADNEPKKTSSNGFWHGFGRIIMYLSRFIQKAGLFIQMYAESLKDKPSVNKQGYIDRWLKAEEPFALLRRI